MTRPSVRAERQGGSGEAFYFGGDEMLARNTRQYCNEVEAQSVPSYRELSDWAQGSNPTDDIYEYSLTVCGRLTHPRLWSELIRKGEEQSQHAAQDGRGMEFAISDSVASIQVSTFNLQQSRIIAQLSCSFPSYY
jgi:hypothetical protein